MLYELEIAEMDGVEGGRHVKYFTGIVQSPQFINVFGFRVWRYNHTGAWKFRLHDFVSRNAGAKYMEKVQANYSSKGIVAVRSHCSVDSERVEEVPNETPEVTVFKELALWIVEKISPKEGETIYNGIFINPEAKAHVMFPQLAKYAEGTTAFGATLSGGQFNGLASFAKITEEVVERKKSAEDARAEHVMFIAQTYPEYGAW